MAEIKDYVTVTVTRATRPLDTAGFGIPMFLASTNLFGVGETNRTYSSTVSMTDDGWPTNHPAFLFATNVFAQDNQPKNIVIGQATYVSYDGTPTVVNDTTYTVKVGVDGFAKEFSFLSSGTATATEIVDGLEALITADSDYTGKVVVTNVTNVLTVTPATGKECFLEDITGNIPVVINTPEDVTTALGNVTTDNDTWFFLSGQSQADADILLFAAHAEANDKMYFVSVPVSTVGAAPTTDIASQLKTLQYDNTQTITVLDVNVAKYAEGASIGVMAATNPGTSTWFGKTLKGVATNSFTTTQETNIIAKNSNHYPLVAGAGFYTDGSQASGEFGDTIRFSLWMKSRTAESVFGLLKRKSDLGLKVPHSEDGYAMVRSVISDEVIQLGVSRGAILTAASGATDPVVLTPKRSEISAANLTARILPDVEVEVVFSGAIQTVIIKVFVLV
jgi:hypothetical protein